ncbi:MAG: hypothetical protein ACI81R_000066 [Bradymonadia bacterium]|jgi:uncharacterized protein (DUF924 family)
MEVPTKAQEILTYWYGPRDSPEYPRKQFGVWFGHDPAVDVDLTERFGETLRDAAAALDDGSAWTVSREGRLARILLFDQLSRNIYRGKAQMYGMDVEALDLAIEGIWLGEDSDALAMEAMFLYMPLMHAESIAIQRWCVRLFAALLEKVRGSADEKTIAGNVAYAIQHRDIVEKFGRFPHRNILLQRETTAAEARFLMTPGSSF